ncbi:Diacylglycerol kinase [Stygiomarasmius scandens]|uniref:Diacylglycerol kinase n=1 Tax=Marasmiellus scandens TaxID=2682957 RepID=A0ABR1IUT0_9AGAR
MPSTLVNPPTLSHERRSTRSLSSNSSSESTRSPSASRVKRRSASPRVSFSSSKLSPEPSGVQNITRKVIRKLEGFGHVDVLEVDENDNDSNEEKDREDSEDMGEVANSLLNGHANGAAATKSSNSVRPNGKKEEKKIDWEIPRKVLHSSIGFFTIYLYLSQGSPRNVILVLWSSLCIIIPADILRLRSSRFEKIYERVLGFLMRESEKHTTNGVIWYILGVNFALTFYPLDIATVAILILSWADTAASTIGRAWGSLTPRLPSRLLGLPLAPRKSLAGFLAASVTGAAIAAGFWGRMAPMRNQASDVSWRWAEGLTLGGTTAGFGGWTGLALIALVAGLVSGVAEALDLGSLDDNLTLPIISGGCLLGFFKLLTVVSSWLV